MPGNEMAARAYGSWPESEQSWDQRSLALYSEYVHLTATAPCRCHKITAHEVVIVDIGFPGKTVQAPSSCSKLIY
jgi:hypothetical protein